MMHHSYRVAMRVAVWNMLINMMLAGVKLTVGFVMRSRALISDGVHSVSDAVGSVVVIVGLCLSAKEPDQCHPYGYERLECVAAVVLAGVVAVSGIGVTVTSVRAMTQGVAPPAAGSLSWITACVAMGVKEIMFRYTRRAAKKSGSAALMADAWHQRTDALSSLGSLIGVVGAQLGIAVMDPLVGVLIAGLILKAAVDVFADATRKMTDRSCDAALQEAIRCCAEQQEQVQEVTQLRTRLFGNRVLAELTIRVACGMKADEAYCVAKSVAATVETAFEDVKMCSVHIHPSEIPLCTVAKSDGV